MKNKKLTYFLLFLVISLWGYLIYKVFGAVTGNTEDISPTAVSRPAIEDLGYYKVKDQDSLVLHYRDPLYVSGGPSKQNTQTVAEPVAAPAPMNMYTAPPVVRETPISYTGFIENENSQKRVAIVSVDNKQHKIGKGESQDGVTVLDIQKTYIRIKHKGNTKTIYK